MRCNEDGVELFIIASYQLDASFHHVVDGNLKAGTYQYLFNATRLASGMYFYRLRSGEFMDTKKMMLVK